MIADRAPYKNLTLTIDTREKSQERISHMKDWFFERGGAVKMGTVKHCDYHIFGTKNGKPVDIGIEFKSVLDLCLNWQELRERFADTCNEYQTVALFVMGRISLTVNDQTGKYFVKVEGTGHDEELQYCLPLAAYHHNLKEWSKQGILITQFDFLWMFGPYIDELLNYTVNYPFAGVRLAQEDPDRMYYSMYAPINGLGPKALDSLKTWCPKDILEKETEIPKLIGKAKAQRLLNAMKGIPEKPKTPKVEKAGVN